MELKCLSSTCGTCSDIVSFASEVGERSVMGKALDFVYGSRPVMRHLYFPDVIGITSPCLHLSQLVFYTIICGHSRWRREQEPVCVD